MNKIRFNKIKQTALVFLAVFLIFTSCNKDLPDATPITPVPHTGPTIGSILNTDTNYAFLKAAVSKAGLLTALEDSSASLTLFAPDNNAFRGLLAAYGLPPDESSIALLPTDAVTGIVSNHIVPGQAYTSALIPETSPNLQLPTNLVLSAPFFRMSVFASKRGTALYANNIPVTRPNITASNGVIQGLPGVLVPSQNVIAQIIGADTSLTYFMAAVARADSGITNDLEKFSYLLAYPPTNFTVFAPNNTAFRSALTNLIAAALIKQGIPPATAQAQAAFLASTPDVFSNPLLFGSLTAQTVRGIIAFHLLGSRYFSVNFAPDNGSVNSLLVLPPPYPQDPIPIQTKVALPSIQVRGAYNIVPGTTIEYFANVIKGDLNAINGVVYIIDQVMLPLPI